MNPLTNTKNLNKINQIELQSGVAGTTGSWHQQYKDSAWIFMGGLPYDLTEGDVISVFSQYGEIVNINLIRDKKTGNQKGFGFLCYEDQRSTILAVDNLNGIKLCGRIIRVDHVEEYKVIMKKDADEVTEKLLWEGCAPKEIFPKNEKQKKKKKDKKSKKKRRISEADSATTDTEMEFKNKKEKIEFKVKKEESKWDLSKVKVEKNVDERRYSESKWDQKYFNKSEHHRKEKHRRHRSRSPNILRR